MALPVSVDATWLNPSSVSLDAGELRRADSAMFAGSESGAQLGVGGGVVRHSALSLGVTVDTSDVVTVRSGAVVIPGNAAAATGCYRSALSVDTTGNLAARNATNPRIDLIIFRALDTDVVSGHGAYTARVEVLTGTPSATPAAPSLPSMAVELARVTVPQTGGGTASVDYTYRTYATAIGATILVPTASRLPASAPAGQAARTLDTLKKYIYDGSAWISEGVFAEARGEITVTISAATLGTQAVTFPAGRFTVSPIITGLTNMGGGLSGNYILRAYSESTTGMSVDAIHKDGAVGSGTVRVHWKAEQATSTSAAG